MRIKLSILLILVCAKFGFAQTFNKTSTFNLSTFYFRSLLVKDSTIYAAGFGADTNEPSKPKMYIANYDLNGTLLEFVNPLDTLSDSFFSAENSILDFDSTLIFLTKYSNSSVFNNPCLYATNKKLEIKTIKKLAYPNYLSVNSFGLTKVSKTKFLLLTSVQYKSGDNIDVFLHLIDRDFSIVWSKMYGVQNKYDVPYSAVKLNSGNLLIGSHRTDAGMTVAGQRYQEQTWIFEIDTAGNMVREFLDTNTRTGPAKGLTQTNDGGFVYCGKYQTGFDGHLGYNYGGSIARVDKTLQLKEWEKVVTDTSGNLISLENIKRQKDDLIAVGNNVGEFQNDWNGLLMGSIIKFDKNGIIQWQRVFPSIDTIGNQSWSYLNDLTIDTKANIISVGEYDPFTGPNQGWILKLDSNGCYDNGFCGYPIVSVKEQLNYENKDLSIYPNPFITEFNLDFQNLQFKSIEIFNFLGNMIYSSDREKAKVDLTGFPSGVYFIKLNTLEGIFIEKIIKE